MIRINLLTEKGKRKIKGPQNLVMSVVIINLSVWLVAIVVILWLHYNVARLGDESSANRTVVETLTKKINEIKKFEKLNKELGERSELIDTLRKNQSVPVRVLDEVSMLVPEGVWLTSLGFKDGIIGLEGNAFSNIDIVAFIDNLKKSSNLSDVYLEESRETEIEKVKVYRFRAHFKVKV